MISQAELSIFIEVTPVFSLARNKGQEKETSGQERQRSVATEEETQADLQKEQTFVKLHLLSHQAEFGVGEQHGQKSLFCPMILR